MLKVLVVEDEELIRKGIALAVDWAALDCVVVGEAANGREALEAVKRYHPSLIITDLKMPEMDGLEMLAALRERGNPAYVSGHYLFFRHIQEGGGGQPLGISGHLPMTAAFPEGRKEFAWTTTI